MELFYAPEAQGSLIALDQEESGHCIKVLRHRIGQEVNVIDGKGTLLKCRIVDDNPKAAQLQVLERIEGFGAVPYRLTLACCPTKNNDRFEWMVEKAVEMGVDRIVPLIGEYSERRVYKKERAQRIAISASKQSLKAMVPEICEPVSVKSFLQQPLEGIGLIAACFTQRESITSALAGVDAATPITVLIGPEGDFSPEELRLAMAAGYRAVHLGASRLRTETAALAAVSAVYFNFISDAYASQD